MYNIYFDYCLLSESGKKRKKNFCRNYMVKITMWVICTKRIIYLTLTAIALLKTT